MGLSITHDTFDGAYGGFAIWRRMIAEIGGYSYREETRPWGTSWIAEIDWENLPTDDALQGHWTQEPRDPLLYLIAHSDADGELSPYRCARLADRLAGLMGAVRAKFADGDYFDRQNVDITQRFIEGLRVAAGKREKIEFH